MIPLTENEHTILSLWICGQTAKQTAMILNKSNRTIESHREKIKCKLGVYCVSDLRTKLLESEEFGEMLKRGLDLLRHSMENNQEFSLINLRNRTCSDQRI